MEVRVTIRVVFGIGVGIGVLNSSCASLFVSPYSVDITFRELPIMV